MWDLDGTEVFSGTSDDGSVVLGVLGESVVSVSDSGLVRVSEPVNGAQPVETQLQKLFTLVTSVTLPKRGKLLVVSKGGFLFQVRFSC